MPFTSHSRWTLRLRDFVAIDSLLRPTQNLADYEKLLLADEGSLFQCLSVIDHL
ncbi:hypothetical protein [Verrucomicrobium sp. BvORR106]|uniref:hypothetical protein n=1 Tax=Verrucomicrobium sp. BvORR106 TaxID=1403819 RepID=UPI002240FF71|nr:hypothetical protein [Verrucomicrobium sp. BvORR106]